MNVHGHPTSDQSFDRLLARALRLEADAVAARQPDASAALASLSRRVAPGASWWLPRRATGFLWLLLLLVAALVGALIGAPLLERRPVVEPGPLGLGYPCSVELAPGRLVEVSRDAAPGEHVVTYFEDGLVSELRAGNLGLTAPGRPRALAIANTLVHEGRLSSDGLAIVRDRLDGLGLSTGCYRVRLPTRSIEPGSLVVRTASGPALFTWIEDGRGNSIEPLLSAHDAQRVLEVLRDLLDPDPNRARDMPDRVATWLPPHAWSEPFDPTSDRWLVEVVFTRTDYGQDAVLEHGSGPPASATDGRFAAIDLPGRATLQTVGVPLAVAAGARPMRCVVLDREAALTLARSLEAVELGVGAEADLFTPDMAWGVDVELIPARSYQDCASLESELRDHVFPPEVMALPTPVGDLVGIDPCDLVPPNARGRVDDYGYGMPQPAFGVPARSCILERRQGFGQLRQWVVLWLYPGTVTEAEAATIAASVFGDKMTITDLGGRTGWLNHCLTSSVECVGGAATWVGGKFLLLERYGSLGLSAGELLRRTKETLASIADQAAR